MRSTSVLYTRCASRTNHNKYDRVRYSNDCHGFSEHVNVYYFNRLIKRSTMNSIDGLKKHRQRQLNKQT